MRKATPRNAATCARIWSRLDKDVSAAAAAALEAPTTKAPPVLPFPMQLQRGNIRANRCRQGGRQRLHCFFAHVLPPSFFFLFRVGIRDSFMHLIPRDFSSRVNSEHCWRGVRQCSGNNPLDLSLLYALKSAGRKRTRGATFLARRIFIGYSVFVFAPVHGFGANKLRHLELMKLQKKRG